MKRHTRIFSAIAMLSAGMLAGCSSGGEGQGFLLGQASKQVFSSITAQRASKGPQPVVQITAKQLANTKVAALQVNPEIRGGSDFLRRVTRRTDGNPGTISVWRASDGALLHLRNGVLIGSRGIGTDIISSDATSTIRAIQSGGNGRGQRRFFISNGDYSDTKLVLSCDIDNLGPADTQIVNIRYTTVHLRETCVGGASGRVRITNDYWVQPGSGLVRRSRQWTGPNSGYFELILLKS
jgi:hypothetical protein